MEAIVRGVRSYRKDGRANSYLVMVEDSVETVGGELVCLKVSP